MAQYTLNTTTAQEAIITRARIEANAIQGGEQFANNGQYLFAVLRDRLLEVYDAQKRADKNRYEDALAVATQEQKDAIAAVLGLAPGTLRPDKA